MERRAVRAAPSASCRHAADRWATTGPQIPFSQHILRAIPAGALSSSLGGLNRLGLIYTAAFANWKEIPSPVFINSPGNLATEGGVYKSFK